MAPKASAFSGDPRQPLSAIPYRRKPLRDEELPPDFTAMLSVLLGLMGTMAKNRLAAWGALFAAASSLANIRYAEVDFKQIMCSCSFAVMAVVTSYMQQKKMMAEHANVVTQDS
mmetsp:Transcript_12921/g.24609  ORF Transcript_12921/g.24609 Transcript_12921/m.24609 type:complete len:114 (-) Transcript_12921:444-785(-)|eukprot:CAMPEP_0114253288 /NCGR_PEP_ID=MMETSP0058-20121206/16306_1 /TAXON_ID=36894 /ORGANISM="Pyramimonas parkeae, CCMP726" /LENGTH=113 /DNA_ID=CAMNT_0001367311 /DNA_START=270 /DNA_END=611 /DNA_ORIENTATION=+